MASWRVTLLPGLLALALSASAARAQPAPITPGETPSEATTKKVEQLYAEGAAL